MIDEAPDITKKPRAGVDTAVLCTLAIVGPQLFGGALPWAVLVITGVSLLALATALWVRRPLRAHVVDGLLVAMAVAWIWTGLQAMPLPAWIGHALDLKSVETVERLHGLSWAGTVPTTISYDPGATRFQILIGITILAAFLSARLGGSSTLRPLAVATVASALLLGFEGLAHRAANTDAVFGIYAPRFAVPRVLTPLMNGNHLGGFSVVGAVIAAGLAAQAGRRERAVWAVGSGLCATTVVLSLSRGALGALVFGFTAFGAWSIARRRSQDRGVAAPLAVAVAGIAGVASFVGLEPLLRRLQIQDLDKLAVAARGFRLLDGSAWWLGIGRGAFSSAFASEEGSRLRYTHPENILVQWTTEWGVPIALILLAVVAVALLRRLRTAREPLVAAVCIAILAIGLQNIVDFSLEMAGIVVVVAALLGAALPSARAEDHSPDAVRAPLLALVVFSVALAVWGPSALRGDTQSFIDRLTRAMQADDEERFRENLRRGLALHPGEPTFALLAGTYAGRKRHPDAARWISVAMEEAPGWAAPHVVVARWLFDGGQIDQALLEIREAELRHPQSALPMLCEILAHAPSMEHVERSAPDGARRVPFLDRAATCAGLPADLRAEIDRAILQDEPGRPSAALRELRRLNSQQRATQAMALLERALEDNPGNATLWGVMIRTHLESGNTEAARVALTKAKSEGLDNRTLNVAQARLEAALGQVDAMRATLTRLRGQARGEARLVAQAFMLQGELEASLGNIEDALSAYQAADRAAPGMRGLERAATLAVQSGRPTQARRIYRVLCERDPGSAACAEEARLEQEATGSSPGRLGP